ncbi:MAG: L-asparaginase [Frankiales bacterium]|nr:L-asparaginase [Frankiales bacterium]
MTALLAEVVRSGYVEGTHTGSVVVLRPDGSVALGLGDLERPVFPRSSNKPLQAVALLDAGWEPASEEQLALATASHSGEPGHLEVVRAMLGELGEDALGNPPMPPLSEQAWHQILRAGGAATRLTMNCSGKHAAMLRTTVANGWDLASYLRVEHPVQRACLHGVERLAGEHVRHVAVDGCGAPQHALTLPGLARAFSALVLGGEHERRTGAAMRAHPWHVGGTGRDVTRLMQGVPGLVAKDGAEGVYAAALPDGTAVALKIADGAGRARTPVLVAALRAVGVDAPVLDELATTPVLGGGVPVGEVRVAGKLAARG